MTEEAREREGIRWILIFAIALSLILLLLAMPFPFWHMINNRSKIVATEALVRSVATAITTYQAKTWSWQVRDPESQTLRTHTYYLFDLNRDGLIDGAPAVTASAHADGDFAPEIVDSGYLGFVAMALPSIKKNFIARNQQPWDAWKHPLRIAFSAKVYGAQGFGIWSAGFDGLDGTADDIRSWDPLPIPSLSCRPRS